MTHLYIELNTGLTEEVNDKVIEKLYKTVTENTLDETSDLKGRLHSTVGYRYLVNHLNTTYSDLHISVDEYTIPFEDPNMLQYLLDLGIGSNGYITEAQAAAATTVANSLNTTITKFNEFKYFTSITENKGGFSGTNTGRMRFYQWTALEEVDISNLTSIGHNNGNGWEDTFCLCTSLKTVTASDKLTLIGYNGFNLCSNLETFTGLSGTIEVWDSSFYNCSKLPQSFFQPLHFLLKSAARGGNFWGCILLTSIDIADDTTYIPQECFYGCTNLTSVTIPSTITNIRLSAFDQCSSLSISIDLPLLNTLGKNAFSGTSILQITNLGNITEIPSDCFRNCAQLTSVQLPNTVTTIGSEAFRECTNLTSINLSNITTTNGERLFEKTKLTTVAFNANYLTTLPARIFLNCSSLTTVTGLSNVTTLDTACFLGCSNLLTIDIDNSKITALEEQCFYGCSNLSNLVTVNFPNLLTMGTSYSAKHQFMSCSLILHVVNLGSITEIGDVYGQGTFDSCTNLQTVTLPETLQTLRYSGLTKCPNVRWVKLLSTSVPFYNTTDGFGNSKSYGIFFGESFRNGDISREYLGLTYPIYVKDELVNDYKSAAGFSPIAFRIKPLSLFATDFPNG